MQEPTRRAVERLAAEQAGAVSRAQALAAGATDSGIEAELKGRRWQRVHPGVYAVFTGPLPFVTRCWAGLLYAGEGAALGLHTAAWLWGLLDSPPRVVSVLIPVHRRADRQPGLRFRRQTHLVDRQHPARRPPCSGLEDTVLDLVDVTARPQDVIDLLIRACQQRRTTAARLSAAAARRKRLRWRRLVREVLSEVREGVQSALERSYLRDVERAHGLPRGQRNQPEGRPGRRRYRDIHYKEYRTAVELDGQVAHPVEAADRDHLRDNELLLDEGTRTLRYGWRSVGVTPCDTADQVVQLLWLGGWSGLPRGCRPGCPVGRYRGKTRMAS